MLTRDNLRNYQRRAYTFIKRNPQSGLFLDMGLGKTVSTLTAMSDLLKTGDVRKVLIVAPLRVVQGVWSQEAKKWSHLKHLTFKLISGPEQKRLMALQSKADIHMINVENFRWLLYVLKNMVRRKGFEWPYDTLIIDESSMFKAAGSKRFTTLRHTLDKFERRHILTGTPSPNGLLDLWSQLYIVDQGTRLGSTVGRYKARFFSPSGYKGYKQELDEGASEKIAELISPVILTMRAEDWLELPPLIKEDVWVDLPPSARKVYNQMEKEMFIELEKGTSEAGHAASVTAKCHQIANGAVFLEDRNGDQTWQAVHDAKIDALKEILNEVGSNALVAYYFKHDLERLRKAFPKAPVIKDAKNQSQLDTMQKEWNAGKHPVMLIHPQGAGHGLNLQDGGHLLVFYSMLFGHEPYRQVIERIGPARQVGKAKRVLVKHILARDTVDEALLAAQRRKFDNERGFIAALHDYRQIKEILG
ncbi:MAG: DEAD/DEAH box helicase [Rhodoferax sp.]|nr:DEAD/DEAH box helicase [Rhodoferax sp.]